MHDRPSRQEIAEWVAAHHQHAQAPCVRVYAIDLCSGEREDRELRCGCLLLGGLGVILLAIVIAQWSEYGILFRAFSIALGAFLVTCCCLSFMIKDDRPSRYMRYDATPSIFATCSVQPAAIGNWTPVSVEWSGLLAIDRHRSGQTVLVFQTHRIMLDRSIEGAFLSSYARELLFRRAAEKHRLRSIPAGALSRIESAKPDAERGLSRVE